MKSLDAIKASGFSWGHLLGFLCILVLILGVCRQLAFAKMYSYKDEKGTVHFVDSSSEIPKSFRKRAKEVETDRDISPAEQSFLEQVSASGQSWAGATGVQAKLQSMTKQFQNLANSKNYQEAVDYIKGVMEPFIQKNVKTNSKNGASKNKLLGDLEGVAENMRAKQVELNRIMRSDDATNN